MFDSVFNLEENIDYFEKYINEDDPFKDYDEAKFKLKIAKVIREAKEMDYKRSIKLEKSLYRIMKKATNAKLRKTNAQKRDEKYEKYLTQIEKEIKAYQKEKVRIKALIDKLDGKLVDVETGKELIVLEKEKFDNELKEEITEIQNKSTAELNAEIAKLKKQHAEKMKKLNEELEESLAKAEARKKERLARLQAKYQEAVGKEKEKQRLLKEKEIARLKEQQRKELEKAKLEAEKKKKKAQTITEAEIKRKPKKQPEEVVESVETVLPDSGTDTNIQNEDIIEINLFDGTDDING
jgi:chromosome segregation ATPase